MKVKVTHKKCFATQTVRVFKKVGKLIKKIKKGVREFVLFPGWRAVDTEINWLAACCMLESAERFQSRGAGQERTKW